MDCYLKFIDYDLYYHACYMIPMKKFNDRLVKKTHEDFHKKHKNMIFKNAQAKTI